MRGHWETVVYVLYVVYVVYVVYETLTLNSQSKYEPCSEKMGFLAKVIESRSSKTWQNVCA